jgi:hypothetical protein
MNGTEARDIKIGAAKNWLKTQPKKTCEALELVR